MYETHKFANTMALTLKICQKQKQKKNCCLFAMNLRKTYQIKHADVNILQIVLFARAHKCFNETSDAEHIDEVNEFLSLTLS